MQDGSGQAGARLTLLGEVRPVPGDDGDARARYVERHPDANEYLSVLDFHLYVLHVRAARFIAGFGDMGWLDGADLVLTA